MATVELKNINKIYDNNVQAVFDFNLKINGFSSKKMKNQYSKASRIWTVGQVVAVLSLLSSADMNIRSSGTLLEDTLLQKLLYEIIIKKGGTSSVYDF